LPPPYDWFGLLKKCFTMYISKGLARTLFNFSRGNKNEKRPNNGRLANDVLIFVMLMLC